MNRKPIHIVHVVYSFATGGLENGIVNIINRLPKDEYKHSIVCVSDHDPIFYQRITSGNTKIYNLNKPAGRSIKWLFDCWLLLLKLKPDICHTRNLSAIEAQLPAWLSGVSYRIHGEHGWDVSDVGGINIKYQKYRRFFKLFIHQYIALSSEAVIYLKEKIRVDQGKINHICNGVDVNKFKVEKSRRLLPEGFADSSHVVFGTVGRLAEIKNQTFLVSTFLKLWREEANAQNNIRLVIIGDGVLLPKLKSLVNEAGASSSVWFAGNRDNVNELMNQLDVFILPSLAEGISNTLLEAMASGLPFIATNVGGNAELVLPAHEKSHIVKVNDIEQLSNAMRQYIALPSLISQDSELVREHCLSKFSLKGMIDQYDLLYQRSN